MASVYKNPGAKKQLMRKNIGHEWLVEQVRTRFIESADVMLKAASTCIDQVIDASIMISDILNEGGKVLVCGNGGSAADAQHLTGELVCRLQLKRPALAALALTTNSSILTAWGNDETFEDIFARQVESLGRKGDVLVAISTSGNSANVLRAAETARTSGLKVVGLTGASGGQLASKCDICLKVPSSNTQHIQECHITIGHILCGLIDHYLFDQE